MTEDNAGRDAYAKGRDAVEAKRYEDAVGLLEASIRQEPHFKALELLGEALLELGRYREAVVPLAAATTLNMQSRAPALLAEVFEKLGDACRAHEMAQTALARSPQNARAQRIIRATQVAYDKMTATGQPTRESM